MGHRAAAASALAVVVAALRRLIDGLETLGVAFPFEEYLPLHRASGALVRVLDGWYPPFAGFFLDYPSRRQQPAALSAVIDALRLQNLRPETRRTPPLGAADHPIVGGGYTGKDRNRSRHIRGLTQFSHC